MLQGHWRQPLGLLVPVWRGLDVAQTINDIDHVACAKLILELETCWPEACTLDADRSFEKVLTDHATQLASDGIGGFRRARSNPASAAMVTTDQRGQQQRTQQRLPYERASPASPTTAAAQRYFCLTNLMKIH